ncbi:preprotein translocase subunit SecE [Candidatus Aerophobetes bacterium]|nr:preprotein translocase subunit SecE [Candidatus Aerophobetes bacterium]
MNNKIKIFLKSVRSEASKVTWPSRKEIVRSTIVVIVAIIIFAIVIGGIDIFFVQLLGFLVG